MTNIIFSMHTGTQAVTVFMNDNLIDSLDLFKRRFVHKRNNAVFVQRLSCAYLKLF